MCEQHVALHDVTDGAMAFLDEMYYSTGTPASLSLESPLTTTDEKVPSGFETNAGSFRAGKNRKADSAGETGGQKTADGFHKFMHEKQGTKPKFVPPEEPTPERKAKDDRPKKTQGGFYRAPPPIERLRDRGALDANPSVSAAMCLAANKLYDCFYEAGLHGIAAQDLTREIKGGTAGSQASQFPRTERAMHNRQMFREACNVMGWFPSFPHRGCGRIIVSVCCYHLGVADAAKIHIGKGRTEVVKGNGLDRVREGLFTLARHWRMI